MADDDTFVVNSDERSTLVEQGKVGEGRLRMLDHMLDKDIALSSVDIRDLRRLIADALAAGAGQLQDTTKTAPDLAEGALP